MKKTAKALTVAALSIVSVSGLAACGGDTESVDTTVAADSSMPAKPEIIVTGQWARQSPMATDMGAAYLTINTNIDDELVGAMVDTSIAAMTQVHETVMGEGDSMKMQEVDKIEIVAGTPTELKPGGYHVMLMNLVKPLELGTEVSVTLKFAKAGDLVVTVPVLEEAP
jgi:periplasmic copper chaperone A